jgi:hypothetical protein
MYYDEQNQIVGITLGDETKLIHASRVSFIIPENAGHWLDRWRPIPWTDVQPMTDAGTVTVTDVKIDKRTKAYRDSVKQNGGT